MSDLVSRAEVIRICEELGQQSADLALYGAPENARSREAMEAAATRLACAVAIMPAVESESEDTEWFWRIVDANGLADLPSDEGEALRLILKRGGFVHSRSS